MCKISNDLKLCTCQLSQTENYWIIYRKKEGQYKVGEIVYDTNTLNIKAQEINKLLNILNQNHPFDFHYIPQEKDKLEMHFSHNGLRSSQPFIYTDGKWIKYTGQGEYELIDYMKGLPCYTQEMIGIIKSPFTKN